MQPHEQASMVTGITSTGVDKVTAKCHHAAGGDGDRDGVWQIFIERFTCETFHADYLKWTKATSQNDRVLGATIDDDGERNGLTPKIGVAVGYLWLIVAMQGLICEGAPRN